MCFYHSYDWTAEVYEESSSPAESATSCHECDEPIPVGATLHSIYMQQYEDCGTCRKGVCECPKDEDGDCPECKCEEPNVGEVEDYWRCDGCHKFLQAVEAAELAAGCPRRAARPLLTGMCEEVSNGGRDEARKYFKQARSQFPELVASGYLGRLWRKMFAR